MPLPDGFVTPEEQAFYDAIYRSYATPDQWLVRETERAQDADRRQALRDLLNPRPPSLPGPFDKEAPDGP